MGFENKNNKVDLLNSIGLIMVFRAYNLRRIKNSIVLTIDIDSILILKFYKVMNSTTSTSFKIYS